MSPWQLSSAFVHGMLNVAPTILLLQAPDLPVLMASGREDWVPGESLKLWPSCCIINASPSKHQLTSWQLLLSLLTESLLLCLNCIGCCFSPSLQRNICFYLQQCEFYCISAGGCWPEMWKNKVSKETVNGLKLIKVQLWVVVGEWQGWGGGGTPAIWQWG